MEQFTSRRARRRRPCIPSAGDSFRRQNRLQRGRSRRIRRHRSQGTRAHPRRLEEGSRRILRRVASPAAAEEPRYEIFHDRLGNAILSWRAKRLQQQERERSQREEAEQKRVADQSKASVRGRSMPPWKDRQDGRPVWARLLPYLVSADGKRLTQAAEASPSWLTATARHAVEVLLRDLIDARVLRASYRSSEAGDSSSKSPDEPIAAAFLEWHSQYVSSLTRVAIPVVRGVVEAIERAAHVEREFPYEAVQRGPV